MNTRVMRGVNRSNQRIVPFTTLTFQYNRQQIISSNLTAIYLRFHKSQVIAVNYAKISRQVDNGCNDKIVSSPTDIIPLQLNIGCCKTLKTRFTSFFILFL